MATIEGKLVIGYVLMVNGDAEAKDAQGNSRPLQVGDPVYANDVITTADPGTILVEFTDGSRLDLGRSSTALLDDNVFNPNLDVNSDPSETSASIDAIQQAILAGEDPTEVAEATAAGEGGEETSEAGSVAPVIELSGMQSTPESGFETTGLEFNFPEGNEELLFLDPDDSVPPVLIGIVGPATVVEGETTTSYTVSLSEAVPAGNSITVMFTYTGTAADGSDYSSQTSVVIAGGTSSSTFNISTIDDAFVDSGENIVVSIANVVDTDSSFDNVAIDPSASSVTTTIVDQTGTDFTPGPEDTTLVSITGPASVVEGENTTDYTVTLTNEVPVGSSVTVNLTYTGTATDGADYTSQTSVVVVGGTSSTTFNLATIDDALADNGENIIITLGTLEDTNNVFENLIADTTNDSVTTTITDQVGTDSPPGDEDTVLASIAGPATVNEGDNTSNYTVTLDTEVPGAVTNTVTVNFTYTGTATDGTDYTSQGSIDIVGGTSSNTFSLATIDDLITEASENIIITIDSVVDNAAVFESVGIDTANDSVTTTILDNDTPPVANDDSYTNIAALSGVEDTPLVINAATLLANDTDADGDTLTITSVSLVDPTSGTISTTDDGMGNILTITFTPALDTPTSAPGGYEPQLTYTVSDGVFTDTATVTISLDAVADPASVTSSLVSSNGFAYSVAGDKVTQETTLYRIDLNTGEVVKIGLLAPEFLPNGDPNPDAFVNYDIEGISYNEADGFLYGFAKQSQNDLLRIDINTGLAEKVQDFSASGSVGATFADGYLYVFTKDGANSELFRIDINNLDGMGSAEIPLGSTSGGVVLNSLAYDTDTGKFYAVAGDGPVNVLYEVTNISDDPSISPTLSQVALFDTLGDPTDLPSGTESLSYGQSGLLWTTDRVTGQIFSINPTTGEVRNEASLDVSDVTADGFENLVIVPDGSNEIAAGDQFAVTLNATFGDFLDGSESHFILLDVVSGFSLVAETVTSLTAGNIYGVPAGDYVLVEADTLIDTATGDATTKVFFNAPDDTDPLAPSLDNYSFNFYAVSIEADDTATGGTLANNLAVVVNSFDIQVFSGSPTEITPVTASVSEEGLLLGSTDAVGTPDTTDASTVTGIVSIVDPDGDTITAVTLTAPADGAFTSGGEAINWSGTGTALDPLIGVTATSGTTIATVTIDTAGNYSFVLSGPVDHVGDVNQEGIESLSFGVNATSGGVTTTAAGALVINVEDDSPVAGPVTDTFYTLDTNLLITLDVSSSMGDPSGIGGTRLEAAVASINTLLDSYDALGDVMVQLVTFSSGATTLGGDNNWVTVAEARTLLAGVTSGGQTDYDAAISQVESTYVAGGVNGSIIGAQNVSYFLSDGQPTQTNGTGSLGIIGNEETVWTDFLIANEINSFALGIGTGITDATPLDPIAYNGQGAANQDAVLVTDFALLDSVLSGTIIDTTATGFLSGSLTEGVVFGSDGGNLESITTSSGTQYTYDVVTNTISITIPGDGTDVASYNAAEFTLTITDVDGGILAINYDTGAYSYDAPPSIPSGTGGTIFDYVLIDNDGDVVSSSATFTVDKTNIIIDEGTFNGTAGADLIIGRPSVGTPTGTAVVTGTVAAGNTFEPQVAGQFAFNYASGLAGVTVVSIIIDLRAGSDDNAVFDTNGLNGGGGPALVGLTGLIAGDISLSPDSTQGNASTLTIDFATGAFQIGDGFTFNVDTDNLNAGGAGPTADDGAAFASSGVTYTVNYSDGSSEVVTYGSDGANGSTASSATTVSNPDGVIVDAGDSDDIVFGTVYDDTLDGGAGNDRLEGDDGDDTLISGGGNDILIGGLGNDIIVDDAASHSTIVFNFDDVGNGTDDVFGFDNINGGLSAGTEGDAIDISDILAGAGYDSATDVIADYVNATYDVGTGDVTISVDTTGNGTTFTDIAVLHDEVGQGSSAATGIDASVTLSQLLNSGTLIIE